MEFSLCTNNKLAQGATTISKILLVTKYFTGKFLEMI